ncbi:MAG TPA: magnesium/cobalt transporter CorA [Chloroflexota bacterium]|nr:magnesium/cobalt transporter CorA [Chloroflexota bacterium]
MERTIKKRSSKAGLPPGTLVHVGKRKADQVSVTVTRYDEAQFEEKVLVLSEEMIPPAEGIGITWINVDGLHEQAVLENVGRLFTLHPLTLEDVLNTEQRPKLEAFEDYLFIVLKTLHWDDKTSATDFEQASIVVGRNFVLTFQERETDVFEPVRQRLRNDKSRIRKLGSDYLAYSLIDVVVDNYFLVLEKLGEKIEDLEEQLVARPGPALLNEAQRLRSQLIFLRKSVWPLREVVSEMSRRETPLIEESTGVYLRDVYDHTVQVMDTVETYRDMIAEMLDIYLSSISNRTNEVMKVLTIIATIFIPLTFIVGLYGMNFDYMPELRSPWGYPAVLTFMAAIAILMVAYFRRKGWM